MQALREDLLFYLNNLYPADFMLIMLVAFLFIVFLIFMIIVRNSGILVSLILFFVVIGLPTVAICGEKLIDSVARKRFIIIDSKRLYPFSNTMHVVFTLQNQSKNTFEYCKVEAKLYKRSDANTSKIYKYKNMFYVLRRKSVVYHRPLAPNALLKGTIIFKDFNSSLNKYNIVTSSTCF